MYIRLENDVVEAEKTTRYVYKIKNQTYTDDTNCWLSHDFNDHYYLIDKENSLTFTYVAAKRTLEKLKNNPNYIHANDLIIVLADNFPSSENIEDLLDCYILQRPNRKPEFLQGYIPNDYSGENKLLGGIWVEQVDGIKDLVIVAERTESGWKMREKNNE